MTKCANNFFSEIYFWKGYGKKCNNPALTNIGRSKDIDDSYLVTTSERRT